MQRARVKDRRLSVRSIQLQGTRVTGVAGAMELGTFAMELETRGKSCDQRDLHGRGSKCQG